MSTSIIYHRIGLCFPADMTGHGEDVFAIVGQVGSSNCYESSGRRARSWSALHFGTHAQVMRDVIDWAAAFEGGMVVMRTMSDRTLPEGYISSSRAVLKKAKDHNMMHGAIPYKGQSLGCHFVTWVPDPATGKPREQSIGTHETDRVRALMADPAFWRRVEERQAFEYLSVSGPRL
jgi:hypothetical protein